MAGGLLSSAPSRRIRADARDVPCGEQRTGGAVEPAGMPGLQCHGPAVQPLQRIEERLDHRPPVFEARRQLRQQAAETGAESGHPGEEVLQRGVDLPQAILVSDRAGKLDREAKPGRHARRPALVGVVTMRSIETGIYLDGVEHRPIALQVGAAARELRGEPVWNRPARATEVHHADGIATTRAAEAGGFEPGRRRDESGAADDGRSRIPAMLRLQLDDAHRRAAGVAVGRRRPPSRPDAPQGGKRIAGDDPSSGPWQIDRGERSLHKFRMTTMAIAFATVLGASAARPAFAELAAGLESGFEIRLTREVRTAPAVAYRVAVRDIGRWWDPSHTYSGNARNLSLTDRPGGCLCERLPGGGVQHLQVVYVDRGRQLRMLGGLGPLQALAAQGALTWTFEPSAGGTRMRWTYRVAGLEPAAVTALSGVVETVVTQQADRLAARLGSVPR